MTTQHLILGGIALAVAYFKGYLPKLLSGVLAPAKPESPAPAGIDQLDARTLGLALVRALKREGEQELHSVLVSEAGDKIKAILKAPFSEGAPPAPEPPK